jgi:cytochrome c553
MAVQRLNRRDQRTSPRPSGLLGDQIGALNLSSMPLVLGVRSRLRSSADDLDQSEEPMKSILCLPLIVLLIPSAYAASLPGDSTAGKSLHDASCMGCHDTGIYSRTGRVVQSLDALEEQLAGCSHMAQKKFSASETQNLIKYLNDQFYHFD